MKASKLIKLLKNIIEKYGDWEVEYQQWTVEYYELWTEKPTELIIDEENKLFIIK